MMRRRHALLYLAVISLLVLITWRRVADVQELDDKAAVFGGLNLTSAAASDSETDKFRSLFAASEREAEQLKQANNDLDVRLARCTSELEHLKSLPSPVSAPDEQHEDALVLFTTATGTHMNELRELAGSLHNQRKSNVDVHYLVIFGFNMPARSVKEISLWRNVEFIDASTSIQLGHVSVHDSESQPSEDEQQQFNSPSTLLNAMDYMLRKYRNVLYVRNDVVFLVDQVHDIGDRIQSVGYIFARDDITQVAAAQPRAKVDYFSAAIMGFRFGSRSAHIFISLMLQCIRGYHCDESFLSALQAEQGKLFADNSPALSSLKLSLSSKDKGFYCYLLLRDDILYAFDRAEESKLLTEHQVISQQFDPLAPFPLPTSGKIPVAIGMPTISVGLNSWEDVAPVRLFVPSLVETVTAEEAKKFEFWVYIGYDDGDQYFDNSTHRKSIHNRMKQQVAVKPNLRVYFVFVRFPFSKGWVTYLWNGLFVMSMRRGCHYFYQVNDDLRLNEPGWTTAFVDKLTANNQMGVVGPYDHLQRGRILTQTFVSRKHYFIFGRLFPIDIKDWFSDDWLTEVYRPTNGLFIMEGITATNTNDKGTRYVICDKPKYGEILDNSRATVDDWMRDIQLLKETQQKSESGQSVASDEQKRLQRELEHGPIYQ